MTSEPHYTSMMQNTEYFELDSEFVGTKFGIWVTPPPEVRIE